MTRDGPAVLPILRRILKFLRFKVIAEDKEIEDGYEKDPSCHVPQRYRNEIAEKTYDIQGGQAVRRYSRS